MIYLVCFLLGVFFNKAISPICDSLVGVFQVWAEKKKADQMVKISMDNAEINDMNSQFDGTDNTQPWWENR
jgi:hypothetical protein